MVGTTIDGRYVVEGLLGEGGMGAVFRARRLVDQARVALKVVWQEGPSSLLPRFLREARLASQIRHPHIVQVLDFGRWGEERDRYFLVSELVEGPSLERVLQTSALTPTEAGELCGQLLEALAHVHARGVLHRDVKPENILVQRLGDGRLIARVTDFGIAASMEPEDGERLTRQGESLGTPLYMAPEQGMGEVLSGPGLDLYPVGVILYRMLTGRHPFEGRALEVMVAKASQDAAWPGDVAGVPEGLIEVVMRLLERRPEARYAVAADALAALRRFRAPVRWETWAWSRAYAGSAATAPSGAPTMESLVEAQTELALSTGRGLWGREAELERLRRLAAEVEGGALRVVLLSGGVGVGKTALARQLGLELAESGRALHIFAGHVRGAGAWDGLRGALDHLLGTIGRGASAVEGAAREWLRRQGEADEAEVAEIVAFLRPTPGGSGAADREGRYASLLVRALRRLGRARPVVLVLDEVEAAGVAMVAFLEVLLLEASLEPWPLLVLATSTRGAGDAAFEAALNRTARFEGQLRRTLTLGALEPETLARGLAAQGIAPALAHRIAHRARGNPLFAEHLVRSSAGLEGTDSTPPGLTSASTLRTGEGGEVPASLRSILEASLEARLARTQRPAQAREWLAWAAVLGEEFDATLLADAVASQPEADRLDEDLDDMLDAGLLEEGRGPGEPLLFPHALLRETLLAGLGARRARRMHRQAAEVREGRLREEDRCAEAGRIGHHWHEAGDDERAASWWLRGFAWEVRTGSAAQAAALGQRVLAILPADDPRRAATVIRCGRLLLEMGDAPAAIALLEPLLGQRDADAALQVGEVLGDLYENLGEVERWRALLTRLEARQEEAGPVGRRAWWRAWALWSNTNGAIEAGNQAALRGAEGAEPGEERFRGATRLAFSHMLCGQHEAAQEQLDLALAEAGSRIDLRIRALRIQGLLYSHMGRLAEALRTQEEVYELARRSGRLGRIPIYHTDVSTIFHIEENLPSARHHAQEAVRTARALGERWAELFGSFQLLVYDLMEGRLEGIFGRLNALEASIRSAGSRLMADGLESMHAWAWAQLGDMERALAITHSRLVHLNLPSLPMVPQFYESLGRLYINHRGPLEETTRQEGLRWLRAAAICWRRCGNVQRSEQVEGFLQRLGAPY